MINVFNIYVDVFRDGDTKVEMSSIGAETCVCKLFLLPLITVRVLIANLTVNH